MRILIADNHFLSKKGLEYIVKQQISLKEYSIMDGIGLKCVSEKIKKFLPDIVLIDYVSVCLSPDDVQKLLVRFSDIKFIFITEWLSKNEITPYLKSDIKWHLLKDCDEQEIIECIQYAYNNQSFFCNKIIQWIQKDNEQITTKEKSSLNCNGVIITQRERQIIQYIAEGLSNKQISDRLNISIHTVLTHRKNIMKKTNVNNTAGLVLFAIKNNIIEHNNRFLFARNG